MQKLAKIIAKLRMFENNCYLQKYALFLKIIIIKNVIFNQIWAIFSRKTVLDSLLVFPSFF